MVLSEGPLTGADFFGVHLPSGSASIPSNKASATGAGRPRSITTHEPAVRSHRCESPWTESGTADFSGRQPLMVVIPAARC